jgi:type I restriction enzyme M protein
MSNASQLVQKLWNYCNVLRDDGMSYGDYVEQLTFLLFLKMDDERREAAEVFGTPFKSAVPKKYNWQSLLKKDGVELEEHYRSLLDELGKQQGLLGVIFRKAQNRIQDPSKLKTLIALINSEMWTGMEVDVKGDLYEGLLEKNAQDVKSGAGQYFTPRPLIRAIVDVVRPRFGERICDPACGTGGFLLAALEAMNKGRRLNRDQLKSLQHESLYGWEIVDSTARLCVMNLYLHGVGMNGGESPIRVEDSLARDPGTRFDVVLSNPPFGKKSSAPILAEKSNGKAKKKDDRPVREDFWATTSNKQLNFIQHIKTLLSDNGRAAVVVPDNVLFEGGAGETIRRKLLHQFDVHTLLRLPTGLFYAQGVKANVLFFERRPVSDKPNTKHLWIYDLRTNMDFTLKQKPLERDDLDEFVTCYNPANRFDRKPTWSEQNPAGRWRAYSYDEIVARDKASLDIFWLRDDSLDDSSNLPDPDILAAQILADLEVALQQFREIVEGLEVDS